MGDESSRVSASIDLDAPGKRRGVLNVPHSRNDSAWGSVQIPISCVAGGGGPTVLFVAGSHGDEYEGPIALMKLAEWLGPDALQGRVIILPTMNHPAVAAGTRLSPIDGLNMNRVFPGKARGSPTEMIAHYVYHHLMARADVVVDIHAGGKTLDFVPCAVMHDLPDAALKARTLEAVKAFGAPLGLVLVELDSEGMLDTAVEALGKAFITTELGGAGMARAATVAVAEAGVRNLLAHFGVLAPEHAAAPAVPTRLMHTPGSGAFVISRDAGMLEMLTDPGAEVRAGQPLARVHFFEDVGREPVTYAAGIDGMLICRHVPGLVARGDCIAVIGQDYPDT